MDITTKINWKAAASATIGLLFALFVLAILGGVIYIALSSPISFFVSVLLIFFVLFWKTIYDEAKKYD